MYTLTTYTCPLDKYGGAMVSEIDCFFVLANEHLYDSRKDCQDMKDIMVKANLKNIVMVENTSTEANNELWPG